MSRPQNPGRPWSRVGRVRRHGPVVLIILAVVAAGVVATVHERAGPPTAPGPGATAGTPAARAAIPPTYAAAVRQGRTARYDWGPDCDRTTGRLKIPTVYAAPCVPVFSGGNGGSTWNGVSKTSINVVYYQPAPGGLAAAVEGTTGTPTASLATARAYVAMLNRINELYGRHVNLIVFHATGAATNTVAATADAVTVAQQLHAFASIGGPVQTSAYADQLALEQVLCIGCGLSTTAGGFQRDAPYLWGDLPSPDSLLNTAVSYLIEQLSGRPAIWAGNPAWHDRTRLFAVVNSVQSPPTADAQHLAAELTRRVDAARVNLALQHSLTYTLDLTTLPDQAATIAAKLKASNATTVVFAGDPIMPIYLTTACAQIDYFPEWVITGTVFTDTSTLARYYNQREWAHAFGISSLAAPTPIQTGDAYRLYRWWYGNRTTPPATKTAGVILQPLLQLFEGIQLAGPRLTPATFAAGMFRAPPAGGGPTSPLQAYGYQGAPPVPSYTWPADYTFIWYDATVKGPDEEGVDGSGLIRYAQGGKRYRAGTVPAAPVPMFAPADSVTAYPTPPRQGQAPSYPPWPGSPAG